ncbi:MAG: ComEC/Rec2 family competence protein [Chloroflexi bacterium]|nr:ComEC/Rec2 family competence protein [Chloroflexota bacterium]
MLPLLVGIWLGANLVGVLLGPPPTLALLLGTVGGLIAVAAFAARSTRPLLPALLLVVAALGLWRGAGSVAAAADDGIERLHGVGLVEIRGTIEDASLARDRTAEYRLRVTAAGLPQSGQTDWQPAQGGALVRLARWPPLQLGDRIRLRGIPTAPAALPGFDYRSYLRLRGVTTVIAEPALLAVEPSGPEPAFALGRLRAGLIGGLALALPEPAAALAAGIAFGERRGIPDDLDQAFARTGLAHLLAVSGSNVSLVGGYTLTAAAVVVGSRRAIWPTLLAIAVYTVLSGGASSVVRAALMGGLALLAGALGRPHHGGSALLVASAVMVAVWPAVLLDLGFQLSALATAALVFLLPQLARPAASGLARHLARAAGETLLVTAAVVAATWPLLVGSFGTLSLVAPIANLLVLPAFGPALALSIPSAVAGMLVPALAPTVGLLALPFLDLMVGLTVLCASAPAALAPVGPLLPEAAVGYYAVLLGAAMALDRSGYFGGASRVVQAAIGQLAGWPSSLVLLSLLAATVAVWTAVVWDREPSPTVAFLDVRSGSATLVRAAGRTILVDGGPSSAALQNELGRRLPAWPRRIDLLVVTRPVDDRLGGIISVIERYQVSAVLAGDRQGRGAVADRYQQLLVERGIAEVRLAGGEVVELGQATRLEVLRGGDDGDPGPPALRVIGPAGSVLITHDLAPDEQLRLAERDGIASTVWRLPEQATRHGPAPALLAAVAPSALVAVPPAQPFGDRAGDAWPGDGDRPLFFTALHGTITVHLGPDAVRIGPDP